jgi:hypothetical protein
MLLANSFPESPTETSGIPAAIATERNKPSVTRRFPTMVRRNLRLMAKLWRGKRRTTETSAAAVTITSFVHNGRSSVYVSTMYLLVEDGDQGTTLGVFATVLTIERKLLP